MIPRPAYLCPRCGASKKVLTSRTQANPNRQFLKCEKCGHFEWLDAVRPASLVKSSSVAQREKTNRPVGEGFTRGAGQVELENEPANVPANVPMDSPAAFLAPTVIAPTIKPELIPSPYQQSIFDFVQGDNGNAVIEAVAGSGKSTTLIKSLDFTDPKADVAFVAFNRHIAKELSERAPSHVHVSTLHALGYENAREALGSNLQVNADKLWNLYDELDPYGQSNELKPAVVRLVELLKGTLREPTEADLNYLTDRYSIEVNGDAERVYALSAALYQRSIAEKTSLDFGDMIHWCATGEIPCRRFDVLFVDEAQDFNAAQRAMALNSVKPNGRIIAVGDRSQSIMGFQGSDTDSIPNFITETNAQTLPLSICYRCPKSVVQLAQTIVPHIEWRDGAPEGVVKDVQSLPNMLPGDMVVCRTNAPLVAPCMELIRRKVKATIRGRDIGNGLISMLKRGEKRANSRQMMDVLSYLDKYVAGEKAKLLRAHKEVRAVALQDQLDTLWALADGCFTTGEVRRNIMQVFSDDKAAVTFSSVHRAKGLEADRVFILRPDLLPFPKAIQDWEQQQERNVTYVAYTRPKQELYFVKE